MGETWETKPPNTKKKVELVKLNDRNDNAKDVNKKIYVCIIQ